MRVTFPTPNGTNEHQTSRTTFSQHGYSTPEHQASSGLRSDKGSCKERVRVTLTIVLMLSVSQIIHQGQGSSTRSPTLTVGIYNGEQDKAETT